MNGMNFFTWIRDGFVAISPARRERCDRKTLGSPASTDELHQALQAYCVSTKDLSPQLAWHMAHQASPRQCSSWQPKTPRPLAERHRKAKPRSRATRRTRKRSAKMRFVTDFALGQRTQKQLAIGLRRDSRIE